MDGVLLIDKPSGPTSHDVVMRLRRASRERSIGHTGTLDPRATGLLLLVIGRATRLASVLSGGDKTYEATIRLGFATDTDDADGRPLGDLRASLPDDGIIATALEQFRGAFEQTPPRHSAKKVGGEKAYDLARRNEPVELKPVTVTVRALHWTSREGDLVRLTVIATSGFYVRALARDLGQHLGCGGHLSALRRTRTEPFDVSAALTLEEAEDRAMAGTLGSHLLSPAAALPHLPAVEVTEAGLKRAVHGNLLTPEHLVRRAVPPATQPGPVRVLAADGRLVALAYSRAGALHPVVVLG